MERKLASIQKILKLDPIEGADRIEKATIQGWQCVVKKGEFKVDDLCIFIELDSLLPANNPAFEFLRKTKEQTLFRIKTMRLKKVLSQGLALPLLAAQVYNPSMKLEEGMDITELMGIRKYEPIIPAQLMGRIKSNFPSWIPKTDETRIQSFPIVLERHKGKLFAATEKLDGSSCTMYLKDDVFGVCSRNMDLFESEDNSFWKVARSNDVEGKLKELTKFFKVNGIAIQGELIGPGIQGNKYGLEATQHRPFSMYLIDDAKFVNHSNFMDICVGLGLQHVPVIFGNIPLNFTMEQILDIAKGNSLLNLKVKREGLVWRPMEEDRDDDLGRLSFKTINNDFLEKFDT